MLTSACCLAVWVRVGVRVRIRFSVWLVSEWLCKRINIQLSVLSLYRTLIGNHYGGRFVKQEQWEHWRAKRIFILVSGSKHRGRLRGSGSITP